MTLFLIESIGTMCINLSNGNGATTFIFSILLKYLKYTQSRGMLKMTYQVNVYASTRNLC